MKQYIQPHTRYIGLLLMVLTLGCFWQPTNAAAEDVVLNPGYITGSLKIGDLEFTSASIRASYGDNTASMYATDGRYTLTVNAPAVGSYNYKISCYLIIKGEGNNSTSLYFKDRYVTVSAGQTSTVDYSFTPGTINGTITNSGSAALIYGHIYAYPYSDDDKTYTRVNFGSDGQFSLPVQPSENIRLVGSYLYQNGQTVPLEGNVSVAANGNVSINWNHNVNINDSPYKRGIITGELNINNLENYKFGHELTFRGPTMTGDSRIGNGMYSISTKVGSYYCQAKLMVYDNRGREVKSIYYPYSLYKKYINVTDGGVTTQSIDANAAFIKGTVTLEAPKLIRDIYKIDHVNVNGLSGNIVNGVNDSKTSGGISYDYLVKPTGDYELIVTEGGWGNFTTEFTYYNPNPSNYISGRLVQYEILYNMSSGPIYVAAGETASYNTTYKAGTVTLVNFSVIGGATVGAPRLYGEKRDYNEKNDINAITYFYAYGHPEQDKVSFVALPGIYDVTASANVGGSNVTFGKMKIEVLPGADVVIDVGGLTLTMDSPAPEFYTSDSTITVSGKVTDEKGVADVSVNGTSVTLTSTNNSDDPNEMSFSTEIDLNYGPNSIQTIATSTDGRNSSDTRTIYRDSGPPTLEWTPAGGSMTSEDSVTVKGTASDDNKITKVTVNGESVLFSSTNNQEDPNEVEFSSTVHLNDGPNQIVVATQDNCRRTTTQTHTVSKVFNSPPTANAGPDQTVSAGADCETMVTLNGAGSSDPDGDALSYLWTGSFGAVSGSQPSLGLGKGTHVITLTVSDGSFSNSDTVTITVVDDTPPELAISLDQTSLWPANHKYVTTNINAQATDNCDAEIGSNIQLVSVTSDESEDMQESGNKKDGGDGNTSADIVIVDSNSVKIRAERSGGGDGRVYTFNYNVIDASGNTTTASATAVVPHSPKKTVVDSGVKYTVRP